MDCCIHCGRVKGDIKTAKCRKCLKSSEYYVIAEEPYIIPASSIPPPTYKTQVCTLCKRICPMTWFTKDKGRCEFCSHSYKVITPEIAAKIRKAVTHQMQVNRITRDANNFTTCKFCKVTIPARYECFHIRTKSHIKALLDFQRDDQASSEEIAQVINHFIKQLEISGK